MCPSTNLKVGNLEFDYELKAKDHIMIDSTIWWVKTNTHKIENKSWYLMYYQIIEELSCSN